LGRLWNAVVRLYAHERPVFFAGLLGLFLGACCFLGVAVHGVIVEPEGNLYKAATFDLAVGIFLLTLALIARAGGVGRGWRFTLVGLALFGYGVETTQIVRGYDPRFSRVSSPLDQAIGGLFFLSALGILVCFLVLMARFFFRTTRAEGGTLILALRYGTFACLLAFGVGIAMSVLGGPRLGESGNLLPLHAAGFHGLQAIPLVALLLDWARVPDSESRRSIHLAGVLWISACLAIAWQTFSGRSVLEPSAATAVALLVLLAWALILSKAFLAFRRSGARLDFLAA
jgi:hypothetical protein